MIKTGKTKLTALFMVLLTLFTALFIPINAAEADTSENVGIEEIMPRAVNSSFNWTYSHHYIHKENDLSIILPEVYIIITVSLTINFHQAHMETDISI